MGAQPFFEEARGGGLYAKNAPQLATSSSRVNLEAGNAPHVHHATASRVVKGEDVLFVHPLGINCHPQSLMYMVCDGHSGVEAANFVASNFLRILNTKLPNKLPNFNAIPASGCVRGMSAAESFSLPPAVQVFAENVRKALCETFVRVDNEWANMMYFSGTTVTVILATGWLLTVANTGDSAAVLDTGYSMLELIKSHRIHSNLEEQARLKQAGQYLAPLGFHLQGPAKPGEHGVGPLRLWPGGLCVSRSIGDMDAGAEVVPVPHIRQLMLPREGSRVIMASDGLWDVLSYSKALKMTRSKPTGAAASTLITAVSRDLRTLDDTSIVVIDLLPSESTSFPIVALKAGVPGGGGANKSGGGGLFSCFKPEVDEPDSRQVPVGSMGHVAFVADMDCLVAYPGLRELLVRSSASTKVQALTPTARAAKVLDLTVHPTMSAGNNSMLGVGGGSNNPSVASGSGEGMAVGGTGSGHGGTLATALRSDMMSDDDGSNSTWLATTSMYMKRSQSHALPSVRVGEAVANGSQSFVQATGFQGDDNGNHPELLETSLSTEMGHDSLFR